GATINRLHTRLRPTHHRRAGRSGNRHDADGQHHEHQCNQQEFLHPSSSVSDRRLLSPLYATLPATSTEHLCRPATLILGGHRSRRKAQSGFSVSGAYLSIVGSVESPVPTVQSNSTAVLDIARLLWTLT